MIKLVPPEDYSGTTTITTSVTSRETGAQESQPVTDNFDVTVRAVAELPEVTASVATSAAKQEDTDTELDLTVNIKDKDGSETLSQVRISGLTSIGEQNNLTGVLVDGNGNLVGSSDGSGTTILSAAEYTASKNGSPIFFRPPADYSGDVSLDIVAVVQEPNGSTATSDPPQSLSFTLAPVSEIPEVSLSNVSIVEFTNDSSIDNASTYKTDLSNITVSLADTSNLTEVKVVLSVANVSDFTLDTSGVTNHGINYNVSSPSPLSITVNKLANGSTIGADLVADITTILSEVKLVPPEDYSGTTTITASVTSTDNGAAESQAVTKDFNITVSAVAETPNLTINSNLDGTEDSHTSLKIDSSIITATSGDESELFQAIKYLVFQLEIKTIVWMMFW